MKKLSDKFEQSKNSKTISYVVYGLNCFAFPPAGVAGLLTRVLEDGKTLEGDNIYLNVSRGVLGVGFGALTLGGVYYMANSEASIIGVVCSLSLGTLSWRFLADSNYLRRVFKRKPKNLEEINP